MLQLILGKQLDGKKPTEPFELVVSDGGDYYPPFRFDDARLVRFIVDNNNEVFSTDSVGLYSKDGTVVYRYAPLAEDAIVCIPEVSVVVEREAYKGAMKAVEMIVSDAVETLHSRCFADCPNLRVIHLGKSVNSVAPDILAGSNNVRFFTVDKENTHFNVFDGCLYTRNLHELLIVPPHKSQVKLSKWCEKISEDAFGENTGITVKGTLRKPRYKR